MTKRDSPISWRPSAEAAEALAYLLEGGCRRGVLLNDLVIREANHVRQIGRGVAAELPHDPPVDLKPANPKCDGPSAPRVGRPDPAKIQEAQRRLLRPRK